MPCNIIIFFLSLFLSSIVILPIPRALRAGLPIYRKPAFKLTIMTSVTIDKELLIELVDFKLNYIVNAIDRILGKWKAPSIESFLNGARDGTYEDAEEETIDLTNLRDRREELYRLRSGWSSANVGHK